MRTGEDYIHRNFTQNEYDEQELGQPVGSICLSDEKCLMVCYFCKNVKGVNEVLSLLNHIKSCDSFTANSKIFSEFAIGIKEEFIDENFAKCQDVSLTSETDENLTKHDGYLSSKLFKSGTSTTCSKTTDLEVHEENCITKYPKQKNGISIKEKKQVFNCEICSATLCSKRNLDIHFRRHTGETTHSCQYCSDSFYTSTDLKNHLVTHTGERNYICEYCDQTFAKSGTLWKHRKRRHPEQPNKCSIQLNTSKNLKEQITSNVEHSHHQKNQTTNNFLCNQCDSDFQLEDELRQHICIRKDSVQCTFCASSFISQDELEIQKRSHSGENSYKCELCTLAFSSKDLLKQHMPKHAEERFKCEYENCAKTYSTLKYLRSHILIHSGKKPENTGKRYKCEYEKCDRSYSVRDSLLIHLRTHTGEKPFKCTFCTLEFHTKLLLKHHTAKHTGERYKCEYGNCTKSYAALQNLRSHILTHTGDKHFKCTFCDDFFISQEELEVHLQSHTHIPNKPLLQEHQPKKKGKRYRCKYEKCTKSYSTLQNLRSHILKHTGKKPFKCTICSCEFHRSILLKNHMANHTGKRYNCKYENCNKSYLTIQNLRSHILVHTGEKPFKCTFCSREFRKNVLLKNHLAKHTGERFKCEYENCNRSYLFKTSLVNHIKSHMAKQRYKCEYTNCDRTYSSKFSLRFHMKSHK